MEFDWDTWIVAERRRDEAHSLGMRSRLEQARKEASRIAERIRAADTDISSIFLFGSTARGDPASENFDIDIAVKDASRFALLESIALADGFSVDLIQLEFASARLVENINREGITLYGQEKLPCPLVGP